MNTKRTLIFALLTLAAFFLPLHAVADDHESANIALVKSGYAAAAAGDMTAVAAMLAPDIVWHEAETLPYGGVHHGPDAVMQQVFAALGEDWSEYAAVPQRFIDGGDHVVVLGEYRGVHSRSGGHLQTPYAHVFRLADGQVVEFHQFTDTAIWLAAIAGESSP